MSLWKRGPILMDLLLGKLSGDAMKFVVESLKGGIVFDAASV